MHITSVMIDWTSCKRNLWISASKTTYKLEIVILKVRLTFSKNLQIWLEKFCELRPWLIIISNKTNFFSSESRIFLFASLYIDECLLEAEPVVAKKNQIIANYWTKFSKNKLNGSRGVESGMSKTLMSTRFLALGINVEWHTGHLGWQKVKLTFMSTGLPPG